MIFFPEHLQIVHGWKTNKSWLPKDKIDEVFNHFTQLHCLYESVFNFWDDFELLSFLALVWELICLVNSGFEWCWHIQDLVGWKRGWAEEVSCLCSCSLCYFYFSLLSLFNFFAYGNRSMHSCTKKESCKWIKTRFYMIFFWYCSIICSQWTICRNIGLCLFRRKNFSQKMFFVFFSIYCRRKTLVNRNDFWNQWKMRHLTLLPTRILIKKNLKARFFLKDIFSRNPLYLVYLYTCMYICLDVCDTHI